mmetsp:Transcript_42483/g.89195  ORF Transcript_42483/g.89195 Transcript_42483/m.89195 type:complete len:374 (-) Transcript_42483:281-1402(-)|eukprot:CAMPEP_0183730602 /NCGR_PEP_ID=MMETSP0737-20130205/33278_1 /TAXON_ID=385413 /ORGANISM="Thalassiosira miniscula, Strain CCMP1093" /LENGTH=373 /DNA_ID=CAMNT_0025963147 /DNA_START=231 /DNA_END=1352 /DNA_ORIENTATION=-
MFTRNQAARSQGNRRALRDVSNQTSENEGKNGQPNVTKRNGSSAALQPQRSVTLESREDVNAATNANNNNNNLPPAANNPALAAPQAPAAGNLDPSNFSSYQYSGPADDIDERDSDDPLCATSYVQDMYEHFRSKEVSTSVRPLYMEDQQFINERMRSILVDWLVEVHLKFKLVPETLYLTVNIIDRYLSKTEVSRPKLQLVGVTALLIASKYEEIYPPELRDLVYICDRAYSKIEILDMEEVILKKLEYQITIPSAHAFLVRYLKAAHADKKIVQLSCFILDGTLQSYNMLHYLPSQLAAAAVFIARRTVGRNAWSPTLLKYAQYREEDIIPVARAVLAEKSDSSTELRAVNKKYTSSRYGGVATILINSNF